VHSQCHELPFPLSRHAARISGGGNIEDCWTHGVVGSERVGKNAGSLGILAVQVSKERCFPFLRLCGLLQQHRCQSISKTHPFHTDDGSGKWQGATTFEDADVELLAVDVLDVLPDVRVDQVRHVALWVPREDTGGRAGGGGGQVRTSVYRIGEGGRIPLPSPHVRGDGQRGTMVNGGRRCTPRMPGMVRGDLVSTRVSGGGGAPGERRRHGRNHLERDGGGWRGGLKPVEGVLAYTLFRLSCLSTEGKQ